MIFNSLAYFAFFLIPASFLFRRVPARFRPWVCFVSGVAFYLYFSNDLFGWQKSVACLLLLLWQTLCCVFLCRPNSKTCYLVVAQAIAILCAFKYLNFFTGLVFSNPQTNPLRWQDAFLPLGISFFTFEFIHYAVDVYKGKSERESLPVLGAFIFFFPTMVAGPIKRIQDFAPNLDHPDPNVSVSVNRGITRILVGLAKKFVIADFLSALTDHLNKNDIARAESRAVLLLWLLAYGFKIYFDFSAYSDIAIGSARLFGIKTPENFDAPYLRRNIAAFWQHWHISLYRWLVDYIFIPLGGSRVTAPLVYRNLVIVMVASGIWHGAGVNFLIWGLWHAMLLCIHRIWTQSGAAQRFATPRWQTSFISWAVTFASVNIGWAFFAMDAGTFAVFFKRLFGA